MTTEEMIKNALCTELDGKDYSAYRLGIDARKVLLPIFAAAGFNDRDFFIDYNRQEIKIEYKRHIIGYINVKKAKGQSYYKYGQSWCDWTYKDFEVDFFGSTVEERIKLIEESIVNETAHKNTQIEQALELIKFAMEKYDKSFYEAASLCDFISKNKYDLSNKIKNKGV